MLFQYSVVICDELEYKALGAYRRADDDIYMCVLQRQQVDEYIYIITLEPKSPHIIVMMRSSRIYIIVSSIIMASWKLVMLLSEQHQRWEM